LTWYHRTKGLAIREGTKKTETRFDGGRDAKNNFQIKKHKEGKGKPNLGGVGGKHSVSKKLLPTEARQKSRKKVCGERVAEGVNCLFVPGGGPG